MCCYERDNKSRHLAIIPDEKRKEVLGEKREREKNGYTNKHAEKRTIKKLY
jgi:hypothetical protein